MDSLKVSLLKCTTASETLVMHLTTFLCLSLVPSGNHIEDRPVYIVYYR